MEARLPLSSVIQVLFMVLTSLGGWFGASKTVLDRFGYDVRHFHAVLLGEILELLVGIRLDVNELGCLFFLGHSVSPFQ
jgi:hypothetical protein